jgi:hypothetical protein
VLVVTVVESSSSSSSSRIDLNYVDVRKIYFLVENGSLCRPARNLKAISTELSSFCYLSLGLILPPSPTQEHLNVHNDTARFM